jgi:Elongation factor Tu C-terminal domain
MCNERRSNHAGPIKRECELRTKLRLAYTLLPLFVLSACSASDDAKTFVLKGGQANPAEISILVSSGNEGRSAAVLTGYRPELHIEGLTEDIACRIDTNDAAGVEPGQTAKVTITCPNDLSLQKGKFGFEILEGGRKAGSGKFLLP